MSANSLDFNLSAEAYESNEDSVGTSDVNSKLSHIKAPPDNDVQSGSEYDIRTRPRESKLQDDSAIGGKLTTAPPSSVKTSTKVLSPRKAKKTRSVPPKMTDTPKRNSKPTPSSISTPLPSSKLVAKVTDIDHLADLAYDISTVIGSRDAAESDNLLPILV